MLNENIRMLVTSRQLLWMWALRDLKVRYKQSVLGSAWAILQPVSLMIIFTVVFNCFVHVPTGGVPYPVFSYTALLPWTFFSASIAFAVPSLVQNINLVTKIYFPREVLVIAAVGACFVDFLVAAVVFIGLIIYYKVPLAPTLCALPLLLLIQILLTLGIAFFVSALNVFYRDIRFVVPLIMQLWMYLTPIIYPVTVVPERIRWLYMLNPMATLIESYRSIVLAGQWPDWIFVGCAALMSMGCCLLGYTYFKRVEWQFADLI